MKHVQVVARTGLRSLVAVLHPCISEAYFGQLDRVHMTSRACGTVPQFAHGRPAQFFSFEVSSRGSSRHLILRFQLWVILRSRPEVMGRTPPPPHVCCTAIPLATASKRHLRSFFFPIQRSLHLNRVGYSDVSCSTSCPVWKCRVSRRAGGEP